MNPFADNPEAETDDLALVAAARDGDETSLKGLIERHQRWIYNIVRRMTYNAWDAEDATQEILLKVITRLATFEGRSSFRTWLYRIAVNHVLNMRRGRHEAAGWTFERYGASLDAVPDDDLVDQGHPSPEMQLLTEEAKIVCATAVLLCLDREQRLVFILGEMLGVNSDVGAQLLEVAPATFRQRLSRARKDLYSFLHGKCGLVNAANPCRCTKKTKGFIAARYVNPQDMTFVGLRVARLRDAAPAVCEDMVQLQADYAALYRDHPFLESPDFAARVKELIARCHERLPH